MSRLLAAAILWSAPSMAATLPDLDASVLESRLASATVRLEIRCGPGGDSGALSAIGSGFLISADGLALTSAHLFAALKEGCALSAGVPGADPRPVPVRQLKVDASTDSALVQIVSARNDLPFLRVGSAAALQKGMAVRIFGFDHGEQPPLAHPGHVSGALEELDSSFNEGASGAPVTLEMCDVVVGMAKAGVRLDGKQLPGQTRMVMIDKAWSALDLAAHGLEQVPGPCMPWPAEAAKGGVFVVTPSTSTGRIPYLRLPKGFRISVDPSVDLVSWVVDILEFGDDTTIDLSAPNVAPAAAANGADKSQPSFGQLGESGGDGENGTEGRRGTSLDLRVGRARAGGSLMIRTNGGPGGAAGRGGNGATGGGTSCGRPPPWLSEPKTHGGHGGNGGNGGRGGRGGATSLVRVQGTDASIPSCSRTCGSDEKAKFIRGGARILIFGSPGCGGAAGVAGTAGGGGGPDRDCVIDWVRSGTAGNPGVGGAAGEPGACTLN